MTTTAHDGPHRTTVRPAERADLLDIAALEERCFPDPWPYAAFERHLDAPAFLVATRDETVIGLVVGDLRGDFFGHLGHIKDLAVDPTVRRRGTGRRLLRTAIELLTEAGADRTSLEVRQSNDPALQLYRSMGFEPTRVRPGYYEDGEDAIVMMRDGQQIGTR